MGAGIFSIVFGAISFFTIGFLSILGFALAISSYTQTSKALSEEDLQDQALVTAQIKGKKISLAALAINAVAVTLYLLKSFGLI